MTPLASRLAAAPISWGVCEVAGWGHQLPAERVLSDIAGLGFAATEAGPDGFLPSDPTSLRSTLAAHGLELVGGFIPVVLHRPELWPMERQAATVRMTALAAAGAEVAVLAAATGERGYESSPELDEDAWARLRRSLEQLEEEARAVGMRLTFHPHHGTAVSSPGQIERFLAETDVALCLDTGHVAVGGGDPVAVARGWPRRIGHVHLKDVELGLAARVRDGELGYREAVAAGMYRPLGEGDVDIAAVVSALEGARFEGWYVYEQDTVLASEEEAEAALAAAASSVRYLESLIRAFPLGSAMQREGGRK